MALWGTADGLYSPGIVSVDYSTKTITGSGTSFTAAGIAAGTVITIGAGGTFGSAVIAGITSDTLLTIATTQYLSGAAISGVGYTLSQRPVYTLEDSNYGNGTGSSIYGVDIYEAQANVNTQYAVTHAGWVGIKTYVGSEGTLRVKTETLVAMSGISTNEGPTYGAVGDAADDVVFPDRLITILTQPQSTSVGVGTTATFSVVASASPIAALSYQWQKSTTSGGTTFSNIGGATSSSVSIANTDGANDGYRYRVTITADGGASATSSAATLTVS